MEHQTELKKIDDWLSSFHQQFELIRSVRMDLESTSTDQINTSPPSRATFLAGNATPSHVCEGNGNGNIKETTPVIASAKPLHVDFLMDMHSAAHPPATLFHMETPIPEIFCPGSPQRIFKSEREHKRQQTRLRKSSRSTHPSPDSSLSVSRPLNDTAESIRSHIARPPNCFFLFRSAYIKEHGKIANQNAASQAASAAWHALASEDKQKYVDEAKKKALEHKLRFPEYKYTPRLARGRGTKAPNPAGTGSQACKEQNLVRNERKHTKQMPSLQLHPNTSTHTDEPIEMNYYPTCLDEYLSWPFEGEKLSQEHSAEPSQGIQQQQYIYD